MVRSTRGLDGTCVEGGRQPRPLPPTAGVQYLLVCRRRASAWPAPAWWGFHLGGGSPTSDRVWLQSEKEERERTGSMQTRHQAQTDLHSGSVVCFEPVWVPDGWRQSVRGKHSEWRGVKQSDNVSFHFSTFTFPLIEGLFDCFIISALCVEYSSRFTVSACLQSAGLFLVDHF